MNGFPKYGAAVFSADLREPLFSGAAAGNLRAQVAQRRFGESDVVFDQSQYFGIGYAFPVNFHRTNLQAFLIYVSRHARSETRTRATDIDPMRAHGKEAKQFALPKKRRVDRHIIQVLPTDLRMID